MQQLKSLTEISRGIWNEIKTKRAYIKSRHMAPDYKQFFKNSD